MNFLLFFTSTPVVTPTEIHVLYSKERDSNIICKNRTKKKYAKYRMTEIKIHGKN